jgi:hypothetical protein
MQHSGPGGMQHSQSGSTLPANVHPGAYSSHAPHQGQTFVSISQAAPHQGQPFAFTPQSTYAAPRRGQSAHYEPQQVARQAGQLTAPQQGWPAANAMQPAPFQGQEYANAAQLDPQPGQFTANATQPAPQQGQANANGNPSSTFLPPMHF